jgi:hypothetical protein
MVPPQTPRCRVMGVQVPRSCKRVTEDQDYVLMSVVLFRRTVDDFKTAARVCGFQVSWRGAGACSRGRLVGGARWYLLTSVLLSSALCLGRRLPESGIIHFLPLANILLAFCARRDISSETALCSFDLSCCCLPEHLCSAHTSQTSCSSSSLGHPVRKMNRMFGWCVQNADVLGGSSMTGRLNRVLSHCIPSTCGAAALPITAPRWCARLWQAFTQTQVVTESCKKYESWWWRASTEARGVAHA